MWIQKDKKYYYIVDSGNFMFVEDRKYKGVLAESKVITELILLGFNIFQPFAENGLYDLIVEKNDKLYRVSIKYSSVYNNSGTCCVTLKTVSRRKDNKVKINYFDKNKFDVLAVYDAINDKVFLLDSKLIKTKCEINFNPKEYDKIIWRVG